MKKLITFKFRKRQNNLMLDNNELFKIKYSNLVVDHKSMLAFYTANFAIAIYLG